MTKTQFPIPPSRAAALTAIEQALPSSGKPGQDLQAALDNTLRQVEDPRDRGLATELAYGYLRLKGRMDFLVRTQLSRPEGTQPLIVRILGIAAYELVHLGSIPPHATLSWAVDAVKARFGQSQGNLANAVLRRIQDLGADAADRPFYSAHSRSHLGEAAAWYSCPGWLADLWRRDYGVEEAVGLMQAQLFAPLTGLRINFTKVGAAELFEELSARPGRLWSASPWVGFDTAAAGPALPEVRRLEQEGLVSRQSPAVGDILHRLSSPSWPDPVWDACCGRGGKTLALLEQGRTHVFSSDPNRKRLRGLGPEALRLGLETPLTFLADAANPPLRATEGTILVDAPCSGLGVLSRRPDAKWKRTRADVDNLARIQAGILTACARALKPGGRLVYMTCTMTRQENDRQAELIDSLGLSCVALAEPVNGPALREFFWGGVWKK
ncbi:RsmB/NOP family class I SAM-dependent RNA methyltransferase [Fundidesulfovibrio terrae]|uniref:RsmB/NOP family class I SAM-dependent RNA methyltransferase n=1 Tax=Fundidesulfovibrio terrae TaxID=2922866 RepID=UPI001FAECE72|nr:transcription antitermination factor NusB [Fundidesulfovibrio terrae]